MVLVHMSYTLSNFELLHFEWFHSNSAAALNTDNITSLYNMHKVLF